MADTAALASAPIPAKKATKQRTSDSKTKKQAVADHPPYERMILTAIAALKDHKGASRQALLKYILANNKVGDPKAVNSHLKVALRRAVKTGVVKQTKGNGVSGRFRLGEKKMAVKKTTKTASKTKAVTTKKRSPKVIPGAATNKAGATAVSKRTSKVKKTKSPKKPKSPKVKKAAKVVTKRPAAKKTTKPLKKTKAAPAAAN